MLIESFCPFFFPFFHLRWLYWDLPPFKLRHFRNELPPLDSLPKKGSELCVCSAGSFSTVCSDKRVLCGRTRLITLDIMSVFLSLLKGGRGKFFGCKPVRVPSPSSWRSSSLSCSSLMWWHSSCNWRSGGVKFELWWLLEPVPADTGLSMSSTISSSSSREKDSLPLLLSEWARELSWRALQLITGWWWGLLLNTELFPFFELWLLGWVLESSSELSQDLLPLSYPLELFEESLWCMKVEIGRMMVPGFGA